MQSLPQKQQSNKSEFEDRIVEILSLCRRLSDSNKENRNKKYSRKAKVFNKKLLENLTFLIEQKTDDFINFLESSKEENNEEINFI